MSLTFPHGPLSDQPAQCNYDLKGPVHRLFFDDFPRRVSAVFGGVTVFDTRRGKLLHETGILPQLYVPRDDVRLDVLDPSDRVTQCPFKGEARYWSIRAEGRHARDTVWAYAGPNDLPWLREYFGFDWDGMDAWFDEDEQVHGHLRDPYHRVDIRESSCRVKVTVDGVTIAETARPRVLSETGLPNRYYIAPEEVRSEYLIHSPTHTVCPYKGTASYKSIALGTRRLKDAAWLYPQPFDDVVKISGWLSFLHEDLVLDVESA